MSFILTSPASQETLNDLFGRKRPFEGRCWQDLLTGPAPKSRFPNIISIVNAVKGGIFTLDLEAHFDVESNIPGVIHISPTDDTSGWKALDILNLPGHLFIGASFFQEMLQDGVVLYNVHDIKHLADSQSVRGSIRKCQRNRSTWTNGNASRCRYTSSYASHSSPVPHDIASRHIDYIYNIGDCDPLFNNNNDMTTSQPSIAIVGAGPSGLAFARILHQGGITPILFELDASPSARGQGGTLDIHEQSGQRAIAAAGLTAEFQKIVRPEGDTLRLADKTGFLHIDEENPGQERPEVDRAQLRRMFAESLPAECIRWGSKVASVAPESNGTKFSITFADGSTTGGFDLVVGADGAWSHVRPLLTDATPFYSGISAIEFHTTHPDMLALVGKGSYFCFSDNKALFGQRQGDGSVRTYAMLRAPETWLEDQAFEFPKDKHRLMEEVYGDWCEANKNLILLSGDEWIVQRKMLMLPVGHTWETRAGVTLLGDAAHLMTPFAGEGVNNALVDGMELAQEVLKSPGDLVKAVKEYEKGMFERVGTVAEQTMQGLEMIFNDRAPLPFKEFMESQGPPPE